MYTDWWLEDQNSTGMHDDPRHLKELVSQVTAAVKAGLERGCANKVRHDQQSRLDLGGVDNGFKGCTRDELRGVGAWAEDQLR